jgi:hypothetical protein
MGTPSLVQTAAAQLAQRVKQLQDKPTELFGTEDAVQSVGCRRNAFGDEFVEVDFKLEPPHFSTETATEAAMQWVEKSLSSLGFDVSFHVNVPSGPDAPTAPAPSRDIAWLTEFPLNWPEPRVQKLYHALADVFAAQSVDSRVELMRSAALSPAEVALETSATEFWRSLLNSAAAQAKLPQLIDAAISRVSGPDEARLRECLGQS